MKKIFLTLFLIFAFTTVGLAQGFFEHTVKEGESVASIVQKYKVSPYEIYQLNPDAKQGIAPGMVLVFLKNSNYPFDSRLIDIKKYKVAKNEKIEAVAKANNIDVATLKKYNPKLYANPIQKGDKLKIPVFANTATASSVEVITVATQKETLSHKVLPKETKYGIAKQYGLTISELEEMNPQIKEGLKEGQVLQISKIKQEVVTVKNDEVVKSDYDYYTVKPKEGFYRLTKNLGITKAELIALNPALKDGVKEGMLLRYPKIEINQHEKVRYNLLDSISNYTPQKATFLLPLRLHKIVDTDSTTADLKKIITKDKVMNIALDYYSGAQMAVDSLQKLGVNIKVKVVDTRFGKDKKANAKRLSEIIAMNYGENEIVFGPIVPVNVKPIVKGLTAKKVNVFVPFALKQKDTSSGLFATATSAKVLKEKMIAYLIEDAKDKNVIIIADNTASEIKNELVSKFPTAKIITPREKQKGLVIPSDFNGVLVEGKENLILLETKKVGLVATVVSILDTKLEKYKIKLATTTSQKQIGNKGIANRYKVKLNYHYPSVYKTKNFTKEDAFVKAYKQRFGQYPNRFAIRGFDVTFDTLLRLANKETLSESMLEIGETSYIENKFDYLQNTTGDFENTAMYILHYTPEYMIEEVKIANESVDALKKDNEKNQKTININND